VSDASVWRRLEKASLEQEIASVRAQLAQTEEDLGFQLQAQEKSLQHAKEALGAYLNPTLPKYHS
jgi:hypothetical protein